MAIELFGYQIGKKPKEEQKDSVRSFAPPISDDGTITVSEGGAFGTTIDLEGKIKNEHQLITRYRDMSMQPEVERAIDDIINETIVLSGDKSSPVEIILDDVEEIPDNVKERVRQEYDEVIGLLGFNKKAYQIFRNWYVDGRIYYHVMIDEKNPRGGIQEVRYIDPRKIKKIRVEKKEQGRATPGVTGILNKKFNEYYIYAPRGISNSSNSQGIKIAMDAIAYSHSGIQNNNNSMVLSHLHKAIKPMNQLRMLEDATVIYRLARAPERRIFYIDVGNLPKGKAEQYLRDMMVKHKNKLVYDANTGEVRDDRKYMTMLEDYWLPRREGGKGTEITTLPGGQNLGELDDVLYFRKKLYEALNVPVTRMENETQFNLGRSTEITRDELKFSKFVNRLRIQFSDLFLQLLEKQVLLKGVMTRKEWDDIKADIYFDFLEDNHFTELKDAEILQNRLQLLRDMDEYVGKYYSVKWVRENVLQQTEDDMKEIDDEIESEAEKYGDDQQDDGQY